MGSAGPRRGRPATRAVRHAGSPRHGAGGRRARTRSSAASSLGYEGF